jgi:glutathione S-transferase
MDELKASLPFGQIPALEVEGVFLAQTDSLLRFAAKPADLYSRDALQAARSDMIVAHQVDIHSAIAKMSFDDVPGAPGTQMVPEELRRRRMAG